VFCAGNAPWRNSAPSATKANPRALADRCPRFAGSLTYQVYQRPFGGVLRRCHPGSAPLPGQERCTCQRTSGATKHRRAARRKEISRKRTPRRSNSPRG
jgi:hypothetical protein